MESFEVSFRSPLSIRYSVFDYSLKPIRIVSVFGRKAPIASIYWRPISLLERKPTRQNGSSQNSKVDSQRVERKTESEEIDLKWETVKLFSEEASNSCSESVMHARFLLRQLVNSKRLNEAQRLYFEKKEEAIDFGVVLETALIDMLMKSGRIDDAFQVFDIMFERNVITWSSIISGCVFNHIHSVAFDLFSQMLKAGVFPNDFTFNVVLQACANGMLVDFGKQVHSLVIRSGFEGDRRLGNCLIDFYSKCHAVGEAYEVLSRMAEPDLVSFTSMITGFCKSGLFDSAASLFKQMFCKGFYPNEYTTSSILVTLECDLGEQIHAYMIKSLLDHSNYSASALIRFYSNRSSSEKSKIIFDKSVDRNIVTWSTMISCFLQNGLVVDALELFFEMAHLGVKPNEYTFATAISACTLCNESIDLGQQLHGWIVKLNLISVGRIYNPLLTMYARNGKVEELSRLFEKIDDPDIVSWCAVMSGYSQNGLDENSANLLCVMHREGVKPNEYAFSSALTSCANVFLHDQGRMFHGFALKLGWDLDVCVANSLINMYGKSGSINDASLAFDVMPIHDIMSWNTLVHSYAQHGQAIKVIQVFEEMLETGYALPDHATLVGVLSALNHVGYVDKAMMYFRTMYNCYGVTPSMCHYSCIIDMMGRAGRLVEAIQIVDEMPFEPDIVIWKSLLGSCVLHKRLELGMFAASRAIEQSPEDSANYILMSNLLSACGKWEDAKHTRKKMEEKGVKKDAGWSWIEVCHEVHIFTSMDRSHPSTEAIYDKLNELAMEMKGYYDISHQSLAAYGLYH